MPPLSSKTYLPHLDGIRALAIILVVLFHMHENYIPNGYYGVDVFLVLSGYLLVGRELKSEKAFRFFDFIKSRLCRLLPPVLLTFAVTLLAVSLLLPQALFDDIIDSFPSVLALMPNTYLSDVTTNYFSADARRFPLMHLWYMGVIFQAYFIFAVLFLLWNVFKCKLPCRVLSLVLISLFSLAIHLSWIGTFFSDNPVFETSTYYYTSARLWEFAGGGHCAFCPFVKR